MAPPFGGRAAREQGRAQAQATVTRAADGGDPGRSWSSLMYPRRPRDLRSANTRDPHREACGARGPAVWCPHRDTALPLPPPLLEHPHFRQQAGGLFPSSNLSGLSTATVTFPATRTTLSTGPRAGDPTAHTGTRSLLAMSYQLRPGRDTGPRWLASCPLGPGYVLHRSVSSPVPQLSAPSVHTLVRGNRGHLPPGGLITLTLLVRLLVASRCENGGNRSREVGFRPSCPWSLLAGGGQRGMRPEATGAQPSLFTHLWVWAWRPRTQGGKDS